MRRERSNPQERPDFKPPKRDNHPLGKEVGSTTTGDAQAFVEQTFRDIRNYGQDADFPVYGTLRSEFTVSKGQRRSNGHERALQGEEDYQGERHDK